MAKAKYKYFTLIGNKNGSISIAEEMGTYPPVNEIVFMDSSCMRFAKLLDRPFALATAEHIELIVDGQENPLLVFALYGGANSENIDKSTVALFLSDEGTPLLTTQEMDSYLLEKIGIDTTNRYIAREFDRNIVALGSLGAYNAKRLVSGVKKYIDVFFSKTEMRKAIRLLLRDEYGFMTMCKKGDEVMRSDDIEVCLSLIDDDYQIEFEKKDGRKMFPFFSKNDEVSAFLTMAAKVLSKCDHARFTPTLLIDLIDAIDEFCLKIDGLDNRETRTAFIRYFETFSSPKPLELNEAVSRAEDCAGILSKAAKIYLKTDNELYFLHHSKILFPYHFQVIPESEQEMLKIFAINEKIILPIKHSLEQNHNTPAWGEIIDEDEIPF